MSEVDLPSALSRVFQVLSAMADAVGEGQTSDWLWFEVDAAVDELMEAAGGETWVHELCDAVGRCVPAARAALADSDGATAVSVLRLHCGVVGEALHRL